MIITIKTDNPIAEFCLFDQGKKLDCLQWEADRQLANQIFTKLEELLKKHNQVWSDLRGIVVFEGPGSFTGLRIGITVADTLAYGLKIPIVAERGENWQSQGIERLQKKQNDKIALPHYGAEANITLPKK